MQHRDSLEVWEGTEEEWDNVQPRIRAMYKPVPGYAPQPTPPEVGNIS